MIAPEYRKMPCVRTALRTKAICIHFSNSVCEETYCLPHTNIPEFIIPHGFRAEDMQLFVICFLTESSTTSF